MRPSLYDLRTAHEACTAMQWLYPENGAKHLALDVLAARLWSCILNRDITHFGDARTAIQIARDLSQENEGSIDPQSAQLLGNIARWFAEQP